MAVRDLYHLNVQVDHERYLPTKNHPDDAGFDLKAKLLHGPISIFPGSRLLVDTGVRLALRPGMEAQIRPRSGLAAKHGITIVNAPGTIDAGYRGEIKIVLLNTDRMVRFVVNDGDRIAQMVIAHVPSVLLHSVETLDETLRGEKGFGSSGVSLAT